MSVLNTHTAIAAFANCADAETAVADLLRDGFLPGRVALFFRGDDLEQAGLGAEQAGFCTEALNQGCAVVFVKAGERYAEAMDLLPRRGGEHLKPQAPPF
ncbi:MAG TPA: hypothetical protein VFA26_24355 [Gemmataceae bacterium]|nr:hypothetical protein [Gemmataceae bacterium]